MYKQATIKRNKNLMKYFDPTVTWQNIYQHIANFIAQNAVWRVRNSFDDFIESSKNI